MSYSPTLGRFIQRDPERYTDGFNLYQVDLSDPVDRVDPFGTDSAPTTQPATQPSQPATPAVPPFTYPGEPPSPYPFAPGNGTFNGAMNYPGFVGEGGSRFDGPDFSLSFLPNKGCACTEIKFEQWIRETRAGAWMWNGSTKGLGGFVIDDGKNSDTNITPAWYPHQQPWTPGKSMSASMTDAPNWGGTITHREFVVYAVCTRGTDAGKSYGTFRWSYYLVNEGVINKNQWGIFSLNGKQVVTIDVQKGPVRGGGPRDTAYVPNN
jgi:hypothetical protein